MSKEKQKGIAELLDAAAARAATLGKTPATSKQCWFLAGLIAKTDDRHLEREAISSSFVLTKQKASFLIGQLAK